MYMIKMLAKKMNFQLLSKLKKRYSSCATLVHNISRNVFVFVRKFSPAVYANVYLNEVTSNGVTGKNMKIAPACLTQLCSVFYSSPEQPCTAASDNVFRTLGYKVCSKNFQKILHCRSNIGLSGALLTLLYVKVTDDMLVRTSVDNHTKLSPSKSTPRPSEDIMDVIEVPVLKSTQNNDKSQHVDGLTMAMANENPLSLSLALLWFYLQQHSKPIGAA
ncbi:hypothetical protein HELRODRAFT_160421 [Helobdella robusta]|uniref:Uncharacterized protein n=1 Tax=Helobdella robusta TaxID=6412 RepID=T1EQ82_HELRO|nr:hypothetical protein HELRODRAFT_160421 [Helobdella robusta]ESO06261.1 hypothetical protein HELRODRAFT_160421 [Helobdella robusta]